MNVLIVESPSKAKSINKYLGSDYKVLASVGHVRDLSAKNDAIDTENDFQMKWETSERGRKIIKEITKQLVQLDSKNSAAYKANSKKALADIDKLTKAIKKDLSKDLRFVVFHDAYQYFEHRFNVDASGSVALGDASSPGPARIAAIRQKVQTLGAHCVFSEPQFRSKIITTVIEGTTARSATLDPLGATLKPGPELYSQLLRNLGDNLLTCLR